MTEITGKDTSEMKEYYKLEYEILELIDNGKTQEALFRLEKEMREGSTDALAIKGFLYIHGVGIDQNVKYGEKLVEEAIEKGNKTALKFFTEEKT